LRGYEKVYSTLATNPLPFFVRVRSSLYKYREREREREYIYTPVRGLRQYYNKYIEGNIYNSIIMGRKFLKSSTNCRTGAKRPSITELLLPDNRGGNLNYCSKKCSSKTPIHYPQMPVLPHQLLPDNRGGNLNYCSKKRHIGKAGWT